MQLQQLFADGLLGVMGGYVATRVMEPVSMTLYKFEPEAARKQEDRVRPGPPYEVAAQKMAKQLGLHLSDKQQEQAGLVFHYGLGDELGCGLPLNPTLHPALATLGRNTHRDLPVLVGG
jgi:hypothetical protein